MIDLLLHLHYNIITKQIQDTNSVEQLRDTLMVEIDVFTRCGFYKPIAKVSLSDKVDIVQTVPLQEVILDSLAELTQFRDGMKALGVLSMLQTHKDFFRSFYCTDSKQSLDAGTCIKFHCILIRKLYGLISCRHHTIVLFYIISITPH